jgi:hypothetical protein
MINNAKESHLRKAKDEKRATELAHKIYKEFDEALLEYANRNNKQMNKFAEDVI